MCIYYICGRDLKWEDIWWESYYFIIIFKKERKVKNSKNISLSTFFFFSLFFVLFFLFSSRFLLAATTPLPQDTTDDVGSHRKTTTTSSSSFCRSFSPPLPFSSSRRIDQGLSGATSGHPRCRRQFQTTPHLLGFKTPLSIYPMNFGNNFNF